MVKVNYEITEPEGLHALPATALIEKLNTLNCDVWASLNGQMIDAKSMFGLMSLGAKYQDVIEFTANGEDEELLRNILLI